MNKITLAGATVAICAPLLAQGSITTPPGGLKNEGAEHVTLFGSYAGARFQQADDMHRGTKTATITQVAFRLDYRNHDATTAMGRSWTSVVLDMSETSNYEAMSYLFGRNITMTPTRVFASQWSWPTQTGFPSSRPARWGGLGGGLRFPFTKPWVYTGRYAILMDYTFRGGTLANKGQWYIHEVVRYYLDNEAFRETKQGTVVGLGPLASPLCADSAITGPSRAYVQAGSYLHGANSSMLTMRNKLGFSHHSYYTAPKGAPVVHALGLGGSTAGVGIGARCNPLYVDFSKPVVLVPLLTMNDSFGYSGLMGWVAPWDNGFARQNIYVQAAWADSKTNAFSLTTAVRLTLPDGQPLPVRSRTKTAVNSNPDAGYAQNTPNSTFTPLFPFAEYRTR